MAKIPIMHRSMSMSPPLGTIQPTAQTIPPRHGDSHPPPAATNLRTISGNFGPDTRARVHFGDWCLPILWENRNFGLEGRPVYTMRNTRTWPLPWFGADARVGTHDGERGPVRPQLAWPLRRPDPDYDPPFGLDHDIERLRGAKVVPDDRMWSTSPPAGAAAPTISGSRFTVTVTAPTLSFRNGGTK
jgi:hypothetical protein